jgi:hypothetical protein
MESFQVAPASRLNVWPPQRPSPLKGILHEHKPPGLVLHPFRVYCVNYKIDKPNLEETHESNCLHTIRITGSSST